MVELKTTTITYVDYHDMVHHVEAKYNINVRDYAGWGAASQKELEAWRLWLKEVHNTTEQELIDRLGHSNELYATTYALPEHLKESRPEYQDFWHWMLDECFYGDPQRGVPQPLNWHEVLTEAEENSAPVWVREILRLFVAEFGDQEYMVVIDW
jgi:hypothetical protein